LPEKDVVINLKIKTSTPAPSPAQQKKVIHATFGKGVVQNQSGMMASVLFERYGLKKIMTRFLDFV
jgi:hypothetical protein